MREKEHLVESLRMMREMAKERIRQLDTGITLYSPERRDYYRSEYNQKIRELDIEIRRLSIRSVS